MGGNPALQVAKTAFSMPFLLIHLHGNVKLFTEFPFPFPFLS